MPYHASSSSSSVPLPFKHCLHHAMQPIPILSHLQNHYMRPWYHLAIITLSLPCIFSCIRSDSFYLAGTGYLWRCCKPYAMTSLALSLRDPNSRAPRPNTVDNLELIPNPLQIVLTITFRKKKARSTVQYLIHALTHSRTAIKINRGPSSL